MKTLHRCVVWMAIVSMLALSACAQTPTAVTPGAAATGAPVTLKIAVIYVLDTLPMYVAQQEGFFEKHDVKVELIPVGSASERDQLIASGQADGMINEVLSTLFYNKEQTRVQVVRTARAATATSPLFSIMASKASGITTPEGLKGVEIGISDGTIIDYLTDRLLEQEGFTAADIKTVAVPNIADRFNLLDKGELKAAVLPMPLSDLAALQGAKVIVNDTVRPEVSFSTYAFRKAVIDEHPQAVKAFLAAIEDAVQAINADGTRWEALLGAQKLVPAPLLKGYTVPQFVTKGVPTEAQFNDVVDWAKAQGLISGSPAYSENINGSLLP